MICPPLYCPRHEVSIWLVDFPSPGTCPVCSHGEDPKALA